MFTVSIYTLYNLLDCFKCSHLNSTLLTLLAYKHFVDNRYQKKQIYLCNRKAKQLKFKQQYITIMISNIGLINAQIAPFSSDSQHLK